jgi:hypothetical protein
MQNLDISDNVFVSLDKTSLRDLGVISLVQLNASRNYIDYIDEEAFLGQSKLQTVDLSSNSLMNIETKTFIRNPSLETLSLSSNQYIRLPEEGPFLASQSLRVLKLSDCNLYHLPLETFQELPNLQELYISHNYLTGLQSEIFSALPKLTHLHLRYNNFSSLNTTVMPQLMNVSNSTDLNGNPWLCDCLMFNTVYSWCLNHSVYLELVCSSPPEFKGKPWNIYEYSGCVNDDTDSADIVEYIPTANYTLSNESVAKYQAQSVPHSSPVRKQVPLVRTNEHYLYISIALFVVLLGLLAGAGFLWWRRVRPHILRRSGPVHSDAEKQGLSCSTV